MTPRSVAGDGFTLMTMHVDLPEPEDPETFMEQPAAGLSFLLATLDRGTGSRASPMSQFYDHGHLTVAQANTDAIGLYESLGFVTTRSDDTEREMWTVVGPKKH